MSRTHPQQPFDAAAYLDWERHQPGRHEFVAGEALYEDVVLDADDGRAIG